MKKNLLLIAALGTILLVSCGNSNNKVKDQAMEDIVEEEFRNEGNLLLPQLFQNQKEQPIPARNQPIRNGMLVMRKMIMVMKLKT